MTTNRTMIGAVLPGRDTVTAILEACGVRRAASDLPAAVDVTITRLARSGERWNTGGRSSSSQDLDAVTITWRTGPGSACLCGATVVQIIEAAFGDEVSVLVDQYAFTAVLNTDQLDAVLALRAERSLTAAVTTLG